jgi:hypothetical protein
MDVVKAKSSSISGARCREKPDVALDAKFLAIRDGS